MIGNKSLQFGIGNGSPLAANIFPDITLTDNVLGTPVYKTVGDFMNLSPSGLISGGVVSDNGDGSVKVEAGSGMVKIADDKNSDTRFFDWAQDLSVPLTDDSINYIYINYNIATEAVTIESTVDFTSLNKNYQFVIAPAFRRGLIIEFINGDGVNLVNARREEWDRLEYRGIERMTGGVVSEKTIRYLEITAAVYYKNYYPAIAAAIDTSAAGRFTAVYRDGGVGWTFLTDQQQFSNILYDNNSGTPGNVDVAKYAVYWVYQCLNGDVYIQYGQLANRNLTQAQDVQPPTAPNYLSAWATLRAKIIILRGAANAIEIQNVEDFKFTEVATSIHNELAGLQGGAASTYYHADQAIDKVSTPQFAGLTLPGSGNLLLIGTDTGAATPAVTLVSQESGYAPPSNCDASSNGDKWVFWNKDYYKGAIGFDTRTMWFQSTEGTETDNNRFKFFAGSAGVPVELLTLGNGNVGFVWNDPGNDIDFRIESDVNENAFFLDGATGNIGFGLVPTANMGGLAIEAGILTLKEISTPTADADYGKIYTKDDNKLYFQDGAGSEHQIALVP